MWHWGGKLEHFAKFKGLLELLKVQGASGESSQVQGGLKVFGLIKTVLKV